MFLWGEAEVLWADAVVNLVRWRRQQKRIAADAVALVVETEAWLATVPDRQDPTANR